MAPTLNLNPVSWIFFQTRGRRLFSLHEQHSKEQQSDPD
jgi:hypothetical protein